MSEAGGAGAAGRLAGWRLVADIGGTNARFARVVGAEGELCDLATLSVSRFASFDDALASYIASCRSDLHPAHGCAGAAVAAAGPVDGDSVQLTNAPWTINRRRLSEGLGGVPVLLVNDLAGVAMALPHLANADSVLLTGDGGRESAQGTMLAVNVGTGFGAAAVIAHAGGWVAVPGEAGHMSLPDVGRLVGCDVARRLATADFQSVEDVLSGRGIVAVYAALGGPVGDGTTAFDVFEAASGTRRDDAAIATVRLAGRLLGSVAGDLLLAMGAWGGVYLTGSVVDGWAGCGDIADFAEPFGAKGAMAGRVQRVAVRRITRAEPALLGLSKADLSKL